MNNDQLKAIFDQQASGYDMRILSVGAGTGSEALYLAKRFPA